MLDYHKHGKIKKKKKKKKKIKYRNIKFIINKYIIIIIIKFFNNG